MRNSNRIENVKNAILDLVFPRHCPVCDEVVPFDEGKVCRSCIRKIKYIKEPRCRICGKQLFDEVQMLCTDCESRKHIFDYGFSLYDYNSMKKSIYRFKYNGRSEYSQFYAEDIYKHLKEEIEAMEADSIIPIPVHVTKQRQRGYNQAQLIAKELSRLTGIPMYTNVVKRVKKTVPQKELDIRGRQNNLKKAFNIATNVVKLNKTILIDDIYTTGTTLDAVALLLKQNGVKDVSFITLSIGEGI